MDVFVNTLRGSQRVDDDLFAAPSFTFSFKGMISLCVTR